MSVVVDFDQDGDRRARRAGGGCNGLGLFQGVEEHRQIAALPSQGDHAVELLRGDPHRIEDAPHPGCRKDLGLGQG